MASCLKQKNPRFALKLCIYVGGGGGGGVALEFFSFPLESGCDKAQELSFELCREKKWKRRIY